MAGVYRRAGRRTPRRFVPLGRVAVVATGSRAVVRRRRVHLPRAHYVLGRRRVVIVGKVRRGRVLVRRHARLTQGPPHSGRRRMRPVLLRTPATPRSRVQPRRRGPRGAIPRGRFRRHPQAPRGVAAPVAPGFSQTLRTIQRQRRKMRERARKRPIFRLLEIPPLVAVDRVEQTTKLRVHATGMYRGRVQRDGVRLARVWSSGLRRGRIVGPGVQASDRNQ